MEDYKLTISSSASTRKSLEAIKFGKHGLDKRRQALLDRIPKPGMWICVDIDSLRMIDLAYLTAMTGHEFAILQSKHADYLFHGTSSECDVLADSFLQEEFLSKRMRIVGHSHPGEVFPEPSSDDRKFLWFIEQKESMVISGVTGACVTFGMYADA